MYQPQQPAYQPQQPQPMAQPMSQPVPAGIGSAPNPNYIAQRDSNYYKHATTAKKGIQKATAELKVQRIDAMLTALKPSLESLTLYSSVVLTVRAPMAGGAPTGKNP